MDLFLFQKINNLVFKWFWLDVLGIFFAKYFEYVLVFCLLLFLAFRFKKYYKMVLSAFISAVISRFVIVEFIRWLWQRPRPFLENNINLLLTSDKPAFPSGHAAFYFAISTIVYFYNKKLGILFYAGTILICISRIFTGLHWPTDTLVGAGIGLLVGCLIYKISNNGRP